MDPTNGGAITTTTTTTTTILPSPTTTATKLAADAPNRRLDGQLAAAKTGGGGEQLHSNSNGRRQRAAQIGAAVGRQQLLYSNERCREQLCHLQLKQDLRLARLVILAGQLLNHAPILLLLGLVSLAPDRLPSWSSAHDGALVWLALVEALTWPLVLIGAHPSLWQAIKQSLTCSHRPSHHQHTRRHPLDAEALHLASDRLFSSSDDDDDDDDDDHEKAAQAEVDSLAGSGLPTNGRGVEEEDVEENDDEDDDDDDSASSLFTKQHLPRPVTRPPPSKVRAYPLPGSAIGCGFEQSQEPAAKRRAPGGRTDHLLLFGRPSESHPDFVLAAAGRSATPTHLAPARRPHGASAANAKHSGGRGGVASLLWPSESGMARTRRRGRGRRAGGLLGATRRLFRLPGDGSKSHRRPRPPSNATNSTTSTAASEAGLMAGAHGLRVITSGGRGVSKRALGSPTSSLSTLIRKFNHDNYASVCQLYERQRNLRHETEATKARTDHLFNEADTENVLIEAMFGGLAENTDGSSGRDEDAERAAGRVLCRKGGLYYDYLLSDEHQQVDEGRLDSVTKQKARLNPLLRLTPRKVDQIERPTSPVAKPSAGVDESNRGVEKEEKHQQEQQQVLARTGSAESIQLLLDKMNDIVRRPSSTSNPTTTTTTVIKKKLTNQPENLIDCAADSTGAGNELENRLPASSESLAAKQTGVRPVEVAQVSLEESLQLAGSLPNQLKQLAALNEVSGAKGAASTCYDYATLRSVDDAMSLVSVSSEFEYHDLNATLPQLQQLQQPIKAKPSAQDESLWQDRLAGGSTVSQVSQTRSSAGATEQRLDQRAPSFLTPATPTKQSGAQVSPKQQPRALNWSLLDLSNSKLEQVARQRAVSGGGQPAEAHLAAPISRGSTTITKQRATGSASSSSSSGSSPPVAKSHQMEGNVRAQVRKMESVAQQVPRPSQPSRAHVTLSDPSNLKHQPPSLIPSATSRLPVALGSPSSRFLARPSGVQARRTGAPKSAAVQGRSTASRASYQVHR